MALSTSLDLRGQQCHGERDQSRAQETDVRGERWWSTVCHGRWYGVPGRRQILRWLDLHNHPAIAGTADDSLYQSESYGNFSYAPPIANGEYEVTLKFADIYQTSVGKRLFNVSIEEKMVLNELDLVAKVGPKTAYDVEIPVTVTDSVLNMTFTSVVGNAQVNGIVVMAK